MLELEALPARYGDSLLLRYGDNLEHLIVIDGGPTSVWNAALEPRLDSLRGDGELQIDLVMVTHIDDDHIHGISDMSNAMIGNQAGGLEVKRLWYNSFQEVAGKYMPFITSLTPAAAGKASTCSVPGLGLRLGAECASLATVGQGMELRDNAKKLAWKVNPGFNGLVMAPDTGTKTVSLDGGMKLTVIGPMESEANALQQDWAVHEQQAANLQPAQAKALIAAFVDKSVYNLSSIVVLAEYGGRRILLTGDARGDLTLKGLEAAGLLDSGSIHVDILKVPHHGSHNNVTKGYFQTIIADHYVISTNGEKFRHPSEETLKMISDARGNDKYTVHFTYPQDKLVDFYNANQSTAPGCSLECRKASAPSLVVSLS